jgi:oligoribonuclease
MKNVVWLDIETTGLDENNHSLLCVGAVKFDDNWANEKKFYQIVFHPDPEKLLWSPTALDMHRKTGLYDQIKGPITDEMKLTDLIMDMPIKEGGVVDIHDLDMNLCRWVCPVRDLAAGRFPKLILAGNSIHFDRKYIKKYLPRFEEMLHYRMIDVSGMYEAFKVFGGIQFDKPQYDHRALNDAYSSIELLKKCMSHLKP